MIFQIITILALAGIFVVLVRRFPATTDTAGRITPFRLKLPTLPKFRLLVPTIRFNLPMLRLPFRRRSVVPQSASTITEQSAPAENFFEQADQAFSNKDFGLAEKLYIQAATQDPDNPKIYSRLGVIYLQQKNYKDARDALLSALKYDDMVASRHYNLALAYQGLGNTKQAFLAVKQALSLDPSNDKYELLRQKFEG